METMKKNRSICCVCRKKRYQENMYRIQQETFILPNRKIVSTFSVCKHACLENLRHKELFNTVSFVQIDETNSDDTKGLISR